jgi:Rieske Fe-S protein
MQRRRNFVQWILGGGLISSFASFLYPVLRFLDPPAVAQASVNEVSAGKIGDLKPHSGKIIRFGNRPVLLIRADETRWNAFSGVCTHLNCTVQFHQERGEIWCACHNGFYDLTGKVVAGPPPRPLEEFDVHVRGEEVVVARRA